MNGAFSSPCAELAARSYVALVHHPVYDKQHQVVSTSVTNLDIHDIARSCCTYGVARYYVVHPVSAQRQLVQRILGYWDDGPGQQQNDFRRTALARVCVQCSMEQTIESIVDERGQQPMVVGTTARLSPSDRVFSAPALRTKLLDGTRPLLLVMGTGWGLTDDFMATVDGVLEPLQGQAPYNHLSVRSATAILLDRLFAEENRT
ncbi:MAG TPA: RNA methyltransferase [Pseudomonadota bacterium]|jgi:hypothetical protein|nr:RNA methyltransferase [Pseudomonadota bacterium]